MLEEFLNKDCSIIVALGLAAMNGGSRPATYVGKILEEDDKTIKVKVAYKTVNNIIENRYDINNIVLINKKYVIAIELM